MKKALSLTLSLIFLFSLAACANNTPGETTDYTKDNIWTNMSESLGTGGDTTFKDAANGDLKTLYGIDEEDLDWHSLRLSSAADSNANEVFIAKVKKDRMADVKQALEGRARTLGETWGNNTEYADQAELVDNYVITDRGDYVMFAIHEKANDMSESFRSFIQS